MSVNTIPEDGSQPKDISRAAELPTWNRLVLEWEQEENKRNPLPSVGAPDVRDRQSYVPKDVNEYMKKRFGPDIEVGIGSRFGKEDRSGYSYNVYLREKNKFLHLAEMSSDRLTISMLPPGYDGSLKKAYEDVQKRNRFLTKDSKPEELERTLWVMRESPDAQAMHKSQVDFSRS